MASTPRIIARDLFYLVTSAGIQELNIFSTNELKTFFQEEINNAVNRCSYQLLAWSIMNNHYLLVVKSSDIPVSKFALRINSCFSKRFNRKHKRVGVTFAGKFSCIVIQDEKVNDIIRYVHLEPVLCDECKIEELDQYPWSGHRTLLNGNYSDNMVDVETVLSRFGDSDPVGSYKDFMKSACKDSEVLNLIKAAEKRRLKSGFPEFGMVGNDDFARKINPEDSIPLKRIPRHLRESITMDDLFNNVKSFMDLNSDDISSQQKLKKPLTAQDVFAVMARDHFEFSTKSIAEYLNVSLSAVSYMVTRGESIPGFRNLNEMIFLDENG